MTTLADIALALSLPLAGINGAGNDCPQDHAPYQLKWTANIANERNASGLPTMAFATSPQGPALPVELKFGGPEHAFRFDSPRVSGNGGGELTLEQRLHMHDEYTTTELLFNRQVSNLSMTIEDIDEDRSFTYPYADTIMLGGWSKNLNSVIEPNIYQDGATQEQNDARRDLRRRLGREDSLEVKPRASGPFDTKKWSSLEAVFPQPVSYVKMTFGSDADLFPPSHFSQSPGVQTIRVTDVKFCVPFGSRVGD